VKRSQDRIQNPATSRKNLEIKQTQGSSNDRVVSTWTSREKVDWRTAAICRLLEPREVHRLASVAQRNFMGKGQILQTGINYSRYSKSISAGFTEPYLFDKNILLGGEIFYRDYNAFNYDQKAAVTTHTRRGRSAASPAWDSRSRNM
jgi:outer membrane protein insertion porin family